MNAIVTNKHHFCKGITLSIQNNKLSWKVDKEMQRYKYGTCGLLQSNRDGILDPQDSLDDFILLINLIFEFTGTLTWWGNENGKYIATFTNNLQIKSMNLLWNTMSSLLELDIVVVIWVIVIQ
jgi:hypothetical protein